jgi:hypothetical protein
MKCAASPDLICRDSSESELKFSPGGVWWAYNFGKSEDMPKNDIPNISAVGMPWGFDLTINAELRTSQLEMRRRIAADLIRFDQIIRQHGNLQLQMILKLERQPRFYFWIRLVETSPGSWDSSLLQQFYNRAEREFPEQRAHWISRIKATPQIGSEAQIAHLENQNRRLNMAIRLARPFSSEDPIWRLPYSDQRGLIVDECRRLKPLVEFFC